MPKLSRRLRVCLGPLVVTLWTLLSATATRAQSPHGSWEHSCIEQGIDASNKVVKGYCGEGGNLGIFKTRRRRTTLIRYDLCAGDIWNDHGHLKCTRQAPYQWTIPASASATCMNSFQVDDRYYAKCKRKVDSWNWTSTPHTTCNSANNSDGNLSCSAEYATGTGGGNNGYPPPQLQSYTLCYMNNGVKQTVTASGYSLQDAIDKFKASIPPNMYGGATSIIVIGGPCA